MRFVPLRYTNKDESRAFAFALTTYFVGDNYHLVGGD